LKIEKVTIKDLKVPEYQQKKPLKRKSVIIFIFLLLFRKNECYRTWRNEKSVEA
jgi:hypothetical protein